MSAVNVNALYPIFTDIDGQPLEDGYVWIGVTGLEPQANPQTAYWDAALTLTATQPVRTRGGYPLNGTAIGRLFTAAPYSIKVQNKRTSTIATDLSASAGAGVGSISFGSTGLTPATPTDGDVVVAGTLAVANGGTGVTTATANGVVYASSTSTLATGSALTFNGTTFQYTGAANFATSTGNVGIGTASPGAVFHTVRTSAGAATVGAFIQNSDNTTSTEVRLAFAANSAPLSSDRYGWIGHVNTGGTNGGALTFATTPGGAAATERARISADGNVVQGTAAVATTATAGFLWITSCAGIPTGAPTAPYTNAAAMVCDTTNNRLYVRVGSTWRYTTLT